MYKSKLKIEKQLSRVANDQRSGARLLKITETYLYHTKLFHLFTSNITKNTLKVSSELY